MSSSFKSTFIGFQGTGLESLSSNGMSLTTNGEAGPLPADAGKSQRSGKMVVIERKRLLRDCLTRCLEVSTLSRVDGFDSVEAFKRASLDSEISVILVSLTMADDVSDTLAGISAALADKQSQDVPVVIMCDADEPRGILAAMASGAKGFIPTATDLDVAVEAVRLVRAGGTFIPECILKAAKANATGTVKSETRQSTAAKSPTGSAAEPGPAKSSLVSASRLSLLTARQAAVVEALRRGKANKTIAYELDMRESTVKVHVRNIMKKLNAKNRTEVAYLASKFSNPSA